jgi:hypothetical protein
MDLERIGTLLSTSGSATPSASGRTVWIKGAATPVKLKDAEA